MDKKFILQDENIKECHNGQEVPLHAGKYRICKYIDALRKYNTTHIDVFTIMFIQLKSKRTHSFRNVFRGRLCG